MWNLMDIGKAVSEKTTFTAYMILYMYTAKGEGRYPLGDKILLVTKVLLL